MLHKEIWEEERNVFCKSQNIHKEQWPSSCQAQASPHPLVLPVGNYQKKCYNATAIPLTTLLIQTEHRKHLVLEWNNHHTAQKNHYLQRSRALRPDLKWTFPYMLSIFFPLFFPTVSLFWQIWNWLAKWYFIQELNMTFTGRFHLKARQSHKSTSNSKIPVQSVGENNHCNCTVLSTHRSQPKDYQNHLVLFYSFTAARLSTRYTQRNTLQGLLVFSLSHHHIRNMHDTALPIQVSNWTMSSP